MKRFVIIAAAVLIAAAGCAPRPVARTITPVELRGGDNMLAPQELYEALAITIPKGEKAQFIFGDNIAGYFEGWTHCYKKAQGYIMVKSATFQDYGTYAGTAANNRDKAIYTKIYPYGARTYFSESVWDEFVMYNRQYAVSVSVHSDDPQNLAVVPLVNMLAEKTTVENHGNVILFYPKNEPTNVDFPIYMAISCDKAFIYKEGDIGRNPELKELFKLKQSMLRAVFTSREAVNDFTVYVAFGFSKQEALAKADALASADSVTLQKQKVYDFLTASYLWTDDMEYNRALMWAKVSSYNLVEEEFGPGIWAGLPWFKDNWGRDTFISLPGTLIVSGMFDEALNVMTNFSTFQNMGNLKLRVQYDNDTAKEAAKNYIKENFGSLITYRGGDMYHSLRIWYISHNAELNAAILKMTNSVTGIKVSYELETNKDYGRIPNRVASMDNIIYNTTDGTPWFIREIYEYLRYTGNTEIVKEVYPVVKRAIEGALRNYTDANGFLTHDDADTWMDARINGGLPWSARGNRAVEIQALWYTSLKIGSELAAMEGDTAKASEWNAIADKLKSKFMTFFWDAPTRTMADRVRADNSRDLKIRPNQLMLLSVPFESRLIDETTEALVLKTAVNNLVYSYGVASLSQDSPYFHPYHDNHYDFYNKDAAYHNGTIWGWNAGFAVTAMTRYGYTELAYMLAKNLGYQILYCGCRGAMSENMDAIQKDTNKLILTGTYDQAWSDAEYSRNGYQDFGGFRPNLLRNTIDLMPSIPTAWKSYYSSFAFGSGAKFIVAFARENGKMKFMVSKTGYEGSLTVNMELAANDRTRYLVSFPLNTDKVEVVFDPATGNATVNGAAVAKKVYLRSQTSAIGELRFATPNVNGVYQCLQTKDWLKGVVERGEFR